MGASIFTRFRKAADFRVFPGLTGWFSIALLAAALTGCAPLELLAPPPSSTPPPTGTKVVLPPTWTRLPETSTPAPTVTPFPTTASTFTPTPTATPTPTGMAVSPPETAAASPTTDWAAARLPDCSFTASEPGVRILPAPFIDPYRVLPTMEPGKPYPAVLTRPTYSLLLEDGKPLGWVDYRLLALDTEGDECFTAYDEREIWDFPLCFFTPLEEISGYTDAEFTEAMHTLSPQTSLVVLYQAESYYFTAYGSSGPSFVVKREEVTTHGNCEDIPTLAKAVTETSLYTDLPNQGGTVVYTLAVDEPVYTQSQRKNGPPPPGVEGSGYWILARRHSWSEDINGWVWSGHIEPK